MTSVGSILGMVHNIHKGFSSQNILDVCPHIMNCRSNHRAVALKNYFVAGNIFAHTGYVCKSLSNSINFLNKTASIALSK